MPPFTLFNSKPKKVTQIKIKLIFNGQFTDYYKLSKHKKNNVVCQFHSNLTIFQLFWSQKSYIILELDHFLFNED